MSHVEAELLAYLDGELSATDRKSVDAHIASCQTCASVLAEMTQLRAGLSTVIPAAYESVHLPATAEARIRDALTAEREKGARAGVWQQGMAGWLAGLGSILQPLGKAAIPLMAVFFVVLTINASRLPLQAGVQETLVLGQNQFAPGTEAGLRVLVRDGASSQPISNADVTVQLRQSRSGLARTVYSGSTDATGSAPVQFEVPAEWAGEAEVVVEASSDLGEDELIAPIRLERSYRLLLSSDKPVYQTGEIIHLRTLALGSVDGRPANGVPTRVEVFDPSGGQLLSQDLVSSEYGIAATDLPLADDAALGQYRLRATTGDTVSELSVEVGQAELPSFLVEVAADAPYYLPGDLVTGQVSADYFFGKPVAGGRVDLRLIGTRLEPGRAPGGGLGEQRIFVRDLRGETDDEGRFAFQFELPDLPDNAFGPDGTLDLALETTVTALTGEAEFGWERLVMASQPMLIDVVAEGGTLRSGIENSLYILTSYPDGRPVAASLQVQLGDGPVLEEATNDFGLAVVRYTPRAMAEGDRTIRVSAEDTAGNAGATSITLPLDEARESLLLRTDRATYQVGDTLVLEVLATGGGSAVYLDVIKGGQTLLTESAPVENGRASLAIDLTPELAGTLELNGYQVVADGSALQDTRVVLVDSPAGLLVDLETDQAEYRPGETADVAVEVQVQSDGQGQQAAVGLAAVNEAVYAQREYQPGFARLYFILDKALQDTNLSLPSDAVESRTDTLVSLRMAQQQAAKASWADYRGPEYTLAVQSIDAEGQAAVNQQRVAAFQRLAVGLSLVLGLLPLLVAGIVLAGLRRSALLGKAAVRAVLTLVAVGIVVVALLLLAPILPELAGGSGMAFPAFGLLWLLLLVGLFIYGWRAPAGPSQTMAWRAQYVAVIVFAYAVLLPLLAYSLGQGAGLPELGLVLLAAGFGILLASLLLFGWGLRLEGRKAAGVLVLALTLIILPLAVTLTSFRAMPEGAVQQLLRPLACGLSIDIAGCPGPTTPAPADVQLQLAAAPEAAEEQPAAEVALLAEGEVEPAAEEAARMIEPAMEPAPEAAEQGEPAAQAQKLVEPETAPAEEGPELSRAVQVTVPVTEATEPVSSEPTATATADGGLEPTPTEELLVQAAGAQPVTTSAAATATPTYTPTPEPTATPSPTPASADASLEPTPEPSEEEAALLAGAPGLGGGGDGAADAAALPEPPPPPPEALPIIRERFPQTLYWNPEVVTDKDGRLEVTIPTGDEITAWRITALAVDRDGLLGSAVAPLVVFQPLFLEPLLPEQMFVGDEVYVPVRIYNYGERSVTVTLSAQASSGLETLVSSQPITVPANEALATPLGLRAVSPGAQSLAITATSADGVQDAWQGSIEVRER